MLDTTTSHLARTRHEEKKTAILRWLSYYHYSTADILCEHLGIKNKNIFSRMAKSNFIRSVKTDVLNYDLIMLTKLGLSLAREFVPEAANYSINPHSISDRLIRHNLSVQMYLNDNADSITKVTPEKAISFDQVSKVPDALLMQNGRRVALEVERHHKSDSRIYMAFYEHALAIGKFNYYDAVTYVFPTPALKNKYLRVFKNPLWPLYEYDSHRRRYVKKPNSWEVPKDIDMRFDFREGRML